MRLFYYATLIAFTILWEAPHQPREGQQLVAHTIVNRAEISGMNIEAVVMQRGQYVGWTPQRRMGWLRCAIEGELPWGLDPVGHLELIRTDDGWLPAIICPDWHRQRLVKITQAGDHRVWWSFSLHQRRALLVVRLRRQESKPRHQSAIPVCDANRT